VRERRGQDRKARPATGVLPEIPCRRLDLPLARIITIRMDDRVAMPAPQLARADTPGEVRLNMPPPHKLAQAREIGTLGAQQPMPRVVHSPEEWRINVSERPAIKETRSKPFLTDVHTLRERARQHLSKGAMTPNYRGDVKQAIEILQSVLATEIVCVLRYTMHAISATGISSEGVKAEFTQHAKEEQQHMMAVAERINQLGGKPNFNPEGLATRSASQYAEGDDLVDMIEENLIAERIAVEHYRELIRFFGDDDPGTRVMLEGILITEEEHANDMHDLLDAHQGASPRPHRKS